MPKLDFHIEATSTESPWYDKPWHLNYWNITYRDGYTSNGNLVGNTVGRDGRSIQCWFTYWLSARNIVRISYTHNTVSPDFVPRGGAWQDYSLGHEMNLHSGFYIRSRMQYEHISRYRLLFSRSGANMTALLELGFAPNKTR